MLSQIKPQEFLNFVLSQIKPQADFDAAGRCWLVVESGVLWATLLLCLPLFAALTALLSQKTWANKG